MVPLHAHSSCRAKWAAIVAPAPSPCISTPHCTGPPGSVRPPARPRIEPAGTPWPEDWTTEKLVIRGQPSTPRVTMSGGVSGADGQHWEGS